MVGRKWFGEFCTGYIASKAAPNYTERLNRFLAVGLVWRPGGRYRHFPYSKILTLRSSVVHGS
jgi:hypothetical protein